MFTTLICALTLSTAIDVVRSKYVLNADAQCWVTQHKVIATWEEAKQHCQREGAVLASPVDETLLSYMQSVITVNKHASPYFIGTKATRNPEPLFVSVEGIPLDNMPEAVIDMIEQLDPRDGDCLSMDHESIRVVPCWTRLPYICYKTINETVGLKPIVGTETLPTTASTITTPFVAPTPDLSIDCVGPGYRFYPSVGCYKIYLRGSMWREANQRCTDEGGYLVILDDKEEAEGITRIFGHRVYTSGIWLGIRDNEGNGAWRTVKGDNLDGKYNVWANYTHNYAGGQHCGGLNLELQLVSYNCIFELASICEKNSYYS